MAFIHSNYLKKKKKNLGGTTEMRVNTLNLSSVMQDQKKKKKKKILYLFIYIFMFLCLLM